MSSDNGSGIDRGESLFEAFTRTSDASRPGANAPGAPAGGAPPVPPAPAAPEPPPVQQKYVWCSDCRAALRTHYFALDTRPLCGKCRVGYANAIDHARGGAGFRHALMLGGGAALACATGLGIILMIIPVFRIFLAIGIGHVVGKAVNKATGDYTMRRYQVLAAVLTYLAIGFGSLAPVVKEMFTAPSAADVRAASLDERVRADEMALSAEQADSDDEEVSEFGEAESAATPEAMPADQLEEMEAEYRRNRAEQFRPPVSAEESAAQSVRAAGFVKGIVVMLGLLFVLPLLSLFGYGLYGIGIGILALGYGVYKAWDITASGTTYQISGPFRVGTGPIPVTLG